MYQVDHRLGRACVHQRVVLLAEGRGNDLSMFLPFTVFERDDVWTVDVKHFVIFEGFGEDCSIGGDFLRRNSFRTE